MEEIKKRGRPRKEQEVINQPVVSSVEENKEIADNGDEIIFVKTKNKFVASKLIENKANVKHISGTGNTANPKYWFLEVSISSLNKLSKEEQDVIEEANLEEISKRIKLSIERKEAERVASAAQKKMPGAEPIASAHY